MSLDQRSCHGTLCPPNNSRQKYGGTLVSRDRQVAVRSLQHIFFSSLIFDIADEWLCLIHFICAIFGKCSFLWTRYVWHFKCLHDQVKEHHHIFSLSELETVNAIVKMMVNVITKNILFYWSTILVLIEHSKYNHGRPRYVTSRGRGWIRFPL